ncbi:MAG: M48 family metallopeptidase [Acidimicrobiales bacterium]
MARAAPEPDSGTPELQSREIIFVTDTSGNTPRSTKQVVRVVWGWWYVFGVPIMCVWLAVTTHDHVVFTIGAVFGVQLAYVYVRSRRYAGPIVNDPTIQSRVSAPLRELCIAAGIAPPRVRIKRTTRPAAVVLQNKVPTLWISPDFIQAADDAELRAVIAHEVTHVQKGDLELAQTRAASLVFLTTIVSIAIIITHESEGWLAVALIYAFMFPVIRLVSVVTGLSARKRETIADVDGAILANDSDAMIRGLEVVYKLGATIQQQVYGPRRIRWILFPYSLPSTSHPSLHERIARLQELSLPALVPTSIVSPEVASVAPTPGTSPPKKRQFDKSGAIRIRVAAAVVLIAAAVLIFHLGTSGTTSGIPANVQSAHGAHYIPLQQLGLNSGMFGFEPLSGSQSHDDFISANDAIHDAESQEGVHPEKGVMMSVAEGDIDNPSLATGVYSAPSTSQDWQPAYLLVFSGPNLASEGFTGVEIVMIDAVNGSVLNAFVFDDLP